MHILDGATREALFRHERKNEWDDAQTGRKFFRLCIEPDLFQTYRSWKGLDVASFLIHQVSEA